VVRHARALGRVGLGRADVHSAVHEHRVERHDLRARALGHLERQRALAARGRPDQDVQLARALHGPILARTQLQPSRRTTRHPRCYAHAHVRPHPGSARALARASPRSRAGAQASADDDAGCSRAERARAGRDPGGASEEAKTLWRALVQTQSGASALPKVTAFELFFDSRVWKDENETSFDNGRIRFLAPNFIDSGLEKGGRRRPARPQRRLDESSPTATPRACRASTSSRTARRSTAPSTSRARS
jgi:hypothetical protein